MRNVLLYVLAVFLLAMSSAKAETSGSEKLDIFVKQVDSFQAQFMQTVIDPQGQVLEEAKGQFILQRPGKFRWDYQEPYPQLIIADGQRIWFYDRDLEQVTVKSQLEALADTPATLLSGETLPENQYLIRDLPSNDGLQWVELIPRQVDSNFKAITLAFAGNDLQQMIMQDSFDQKTHLVFSQVKKNIEFKPAIFQFTPPEGVDVVGDTP